MKKFLCVLLLIFLIVLFSFGIYKFIEFLDYNSSISNLEKYEFISNEKIIKIFSYNNKNYVITMYYDNTSSWSHINLLLKDKENYYILEKIKKCDTYEEANNLYIKNNEVYIHCIGKEGNIDKYIIDSFKVTKEILEFNYKNTPNISRVHIEIDGIDDEYIYLSSPFKVDNTISDDPQVKCSLKNRKCSYY